MLKVVQTVRARAGVVGEYVMNGVRSACPRGRETADGFSSGLTPWRRDGRHRGPGLVRDGKRAPTVEGFRKFP